MAPAMLKAMAMKNGLLEEADIEIFGKVDNSFSSDARLLHFGPQEEAMETVFERNHLFEEVKRLFFLMRPAEEGIKQ